MNVLGRGDVPNPFAPGGAAYPKPTGVTTAPPPPGADPRSRTPGAQAAYAPKPAPVTVPEAPDWVTAAAVVIALGGIAYAIYYVLKK